MGSFFVKTKNIDNKFEIHHTTFPSILLSFPNLSFRDYGNVKKLVQFHDKK